MRIRCDLDRLGRVVRPALAVLALLLAPSAASADMMGLLVPAYFSSTSPDWNRLDAAAAHVSVTAILNPSNGPGSGVDPNFAADANNLRAAGGSVVGYVYTSYGARSLATVESDMAQYASTYNVNGFFIDQMANESGHLAYYTSLYAYAKSLNPSYRVIGNPGTNTLEAYLTSPAADTLVTFENDGSAYPGATPAPYAANHPASQFANLLYDVPTAGAMLSDLSLAASRNVGLIYVTDNPSASNPYNRLPSYFDQEVAALSSVPEPASIAILGLGLGLVALVRRWGNS